MRFALVCIVFCLSSEAYSQCDQPREIDTCHYVIGSSNVSAGCIITSCSQEPVIDVIDNVRGKVSFTLPALNPYCNVTEYHVALRVSPTAADCDSLDTEWKTHSKRHVRVVYCSADDTACMAKTPKCAENHVVNFGYVYPGWYQLKVTPHLGSSTRKAQRSRPIRLDTAYQPRGLVDLNSIVSSLQYRYDNSESRVSFSFNPGLDWGEADHFHVTLRIMAWLDGHSQNSDCYALAKERSCCEFHVEAGTGTANCTAPNLSSTPICGATPSSVYCQYRNMTPGSYCAIIYFQDDRCEPDTVWSAPDFKSCQWVVSKEFRAENIADSQRATVIESSSSIVLAIVGAVLGGSLVIVVLILVIRHRVKRRQQIPQEIVYLHSSCRHLFDPNTTIWYYEQSAEGPHHRFSLDPISSRHFSFSNQFTLTDRPRPEVLLVYCRDSKPFTELVVALRNVLNKICKCQVYDYFDEALWNNVSVDPEGWVRELIMEREAKVVLVASRAAAINNKTDAVTYRNPHAFDHLFPYIIKLLRDSPNENSYRNHFVVTFDGYIDNNQVVEHLNPYTRFVLPKHLNKLFEHLHDANTTVHFDTSRKLEEREEVRQLRLRLEHLINLNLLSRNEQDHIYDW